MSVTHLCITSICGISSIANRFTYRAQRVPRALLEVHWVLASRRCVRFLRNLIQQIFTGTHIEHVRSLSRRHYRYE